MDDKILDQQMDAARIKIDEKAKQIASVRKALEIHDNAILKNIINVLFCFGIAITVLIYGRRLLGIFFDLQSLPEQGKLFLYTNGFIIGIIILFLLLGIRECIRFKKVINVKRAISNLDKLHKYLKNTGAQLGVLKNVFKDAMDQEGGTPVSTSLDVDNEITRCTKHASQRGTPAFNKTLKVLSYAMLIAAMPLFILLPKFDDASGDTIGDIIVVHGKQAAIKAKGGIMYPQIQEDGYDDLLGNLKEKEFLLGEIQTDLNLRKDYTTSSDIITVMYKKDHYFVMGEKKGWYFGWHHEGKNYGWASKKYIKLKIKNDLETKKMWSEQVIGEEI